MRHLSTLALTAASAAAFSSSPALISRSTYVNIKHVLQMSNNNDEIKNNDNNLANEMHDNLHPSNFLKTASMLLAVATITLSNPLPSSAFIDSAMFKQQQESFSKLMITPIFKNKVAKTNDKPYTPSYVIPNTYFGKKVDETALIDETVLVKKVEHNPEERDPIAEETAEIKEISLAKNANEIQMEISAPLAFGDANTSTNEEESKSTEDSTVTSSVETTFASIVAEEKLEKIPQVQENLLTKKVEDKLDESTPMFAESVDVGKTILATNTEEFENDISGDRVSDVIEILDEQPVYDTLSVSNVNNKETDESIQVDETLLAKETHKDTEDTATALMENIEIEESVTAANEDEANNEIKSVDKKFDEEFQIEENLLAKEVKEILEDIAPIRVESAKVEETLLAKKSENTENDVPAVSVLEVIEKVDEKTVYQDIIASSGDDEKVDDEPKTEGILLVKEDEEISPVIVESTEVDESLLAKNEEEAEKDNKYSLEAMISHDEVTPIINEKSNKIAVAFEENDKDTDVNLLAKQVIQDSAKKSSALSESIEVGLATFSEENLEGESSVTIASDEIETPLI